MKEKRSVPWNWRKFAEFQRKQWKYFLSSSWQMQPSLLFMSCTQPCSSVNKACGCWFILGSLQKGKGLFLLRYCLCLHSVHLERQVRRHSSTRRVFGPTQDEVFEGGGGGRPAVHHGQVVPAWLRPKLVQNIWTWPEEEWEIVTAVIAKLASDWSENTLLQALWLANGYQLSY